MRGYNITGHRRHCSITASTISCRSKRAHSSIIRVSSSLTLAILDRETLSYSTPDIIVDWVQIRWIRRPQCWRTEVGHFRSRKAVATVSRARQKQFCRVFSETRICIRHTRSVVILLHVPLSPLLSLSLSLSLFLSLSLSLLFSNHNFISDMWLVFCQGAFVTACAVLYGAVDTVVFIIIIIIIIIYPLSSLFSPLSSLLYLLYSLSFTGVNPEGSGPRPPTL